MNMKKVIVVIILFTSVVGMAQRDVLTNRKVPTNKKIELVKNKLIIDGDRYSNYEVKNFLKTANYQAYTYFRKYNRKTSIGGLLLGSGTALLIADAVKASVSRDDYPSGFSYVGAGLAVVAVPILINKKKKLRKSLEMYNATVSDKKMGATYNVKLLGNLNGVGVAVRF